MAGVGEVLQNAPQNKSTGDCEDLDKVLMAVVKRRKTIPTKCMDINKKIAASELSRLENAKVAEEEFENKKKFRKIVQGFKKIKPFYFTLNDLNEAEQKLEKYFKRIKEINHYLEKRKKFLN